MSEKRRHRIFIAFFALAASFGLMLLFRILLMPDISVLERIAAGEINVPVRDLCGKELFIYTAPVYGERKTVPLDQIADELIAATIAAEDRSFFTNPGFSVKSIVRAAAQNLILRTTYSGASTITQQVVKNILLPPDIRYERSLSRKAEEILLAAAVTSRYSKEMILSLYLNEIYYGQNAVGVENAAEIYFGKHASDLNLEEAAFIAGLPQAPNYYGIDTDAGAGRQRGVLLAVEQTIRDDGCIPLESGRDPKKYCPPREELDRALGR